MQYRKLGATNLSVSAVCMGGWSIVTDDFTWGRQAIDDSIAAIRASLDAGVNFFDTAEAYGNGESEDILAKALEGSRKRVVIASKVGGEHLTADALAAACENSLRRLKTDYIDLYQVHWPSPTVPLAETLGALERLKQQGKILAIGVSNFGPDYLAETVAIARVESNQLPYSLLWRPIEAEIQPLCTQHKIGILCYSPLCQGLLAGKFVDADSVPDTRARTRLFSKARPHVRHGQAGAEAETFAALRDIARICSDLKAPMSHVALAWLLARPAVTSVVAGARNAQQARDNAAAADLRLSAEALARLSEATDRVKEMMGTNADPWQAVSRMVRN